MSSPADAFVRFTAGAEQFEIYFPNVGNMREMVESVLTGREYQRLHLQNHRVAAIVDVGANVGASAIFFHACFPDAIIHCYEPSPANFAYLQRNLAGRTNFVLHPVGLSDREETVKLFTGYGQTMQNSVVQSIQTTEAYETAMLRRASVEFDANNLRDLGVLKVDTEGCEMPIFRDLGIDRLRRVDLLYVEYHADEDRRAIDALLGDDFLLAQARASLPHRGTLLYVSRRLTARYRDLDAGRMTRG